ncbi:rplP, partial [Symbiodinium pilosum]
PEREHRTPGAQRARHPTGQDLGGCEATPDHCGPDRAWAQDPSKVSRTKGRLSCQCPRYLRSHTQATRCEDGSGEGQHRVLRCTRPCRAGHVQ